MGEVSLAEAKVKFEAATTAGQTAETKENEYTSLDTAMVVSFVNNLQTQMGVNCDKIMTQVQRTIDSGDFTEASNTKLAEFKAAMETWKGNMPELEGESL